MPENTFQDSQVDGVQRGPPLGIKVVIIGAGVAGLTTALECWRKGCDPVVLEKAPEPSMIGDFFTIAPSALTTLKHYPRMHAEYHERIYDCTVNIFSPSGQRLHGSLPEWKQPGAQHAAPDVDVSFLKRRPDHVRMLLNQVHRLGIPVHWSQPVVQVVEAPTGVQVQTATGLHIEGDLCVGALGIGSTSIAGFRAGPDVAVQDSGYAAARVAFPTSAVRARPLAASLIPADVEKHPEFRTYVGKDVHLILFITVDWAAIVFTHADDGQAQESWAAHRTLDTEQLVAQLAQAGDDWDPAVLDFVRAAPAGGFVDWKLRWRDGVRQWTSDGGRLVRVGDAAHAFLPTAGNGAVQAIEDAVSLAECIACAGREGLADATKVHNALRFERVSILQRVGFLNREELHTVDIEALKTGKQAGHDVGFHKSGRWVWSHDPEAYARDNYDACRECLAHGTAFENTNVPRGHVYEPWSLESENQRMKAGIKSGLKQNGDWSS